MAKKPARPRKKGRPSAYTHKIAEVICARLANGESLRRICCDDKMPTQSMVYRWLGHKEREDFRERYARAREAQAEAIFDEMLDIADDGSNDWMEGQEGGVDYNGDAVQRSKLRIDTRKWMAAKLAPKKYGDSTTIKHADADGEKIAVDDVTRAARLAALAQQINRKQEGGDDAAD